MTAYPDSSHDELLAQAFRDNAPVASPFDAEADGEGLVQVRRKAEPTVGELDLAQRFAQRRVSRESTIRSQDAEDIYEVEYRKLRLEQVILVGVWTEGTVAEVEAAMDELALLTETAGAEVVEALYQKRDRPDPSTYIGRG